MPDIKQFVVDYIQSKHTLPPNVDELNFAEEGYIDSIAMIQFVGEIEDTFGIEFTDEELTDPGFKTVGTLVDIIRQKVERKR